MHDLIGTVNNPNISTDIHSQIVEATEAQSSIKNENNKNSREATDRRWESEAFHGLDDVTTTKKCKSSPSAYSPSATARRAEEMLSSLGESIELTSTSSSKKNDSQESEETQRDILKVGERRKRKLNEEQHVPKYDVGEVSNVLAEVSLELNDILGQGKPGYPLNSIFCLPAKMIRLQFDAHGDGTNVDKSNENVQLTSPKSTHSHPLLLLHDIDKITRVAASQVNDIQESKQETESDEKSSSNANGQTDKQTEHAHTAERETEREQQSSNGTVCDVKESVGGPSRKEVSSDSVREEKERRCARRRCRHRCSKRHKRKKRKQFDADEISNCGKNKVKFLSVSY